MKVIVGVSGASGIHYAFGLVKALKEKKAEVHLIVSEWGKKIIEEETGKKAGDLEKMAENVYDNKNLGETISSSSALFDAVVVVPASIKTVSEIANAWTGSLISKCADNALRMRKKLVVCVRETPLSAGALKNMHKIASAGGIIFPLSPGFYHKPKNIKELDAFITGKLLDLLEIENENFERWKG